jgi:hypothetical protein
MLLDDIATYLTAQGAVSAGWSLYKGFMPDDSIAQVIAIFETGGYPADTLGRENENVTFQLRVRGARLDYPTVRAKWKQCFDLLQDAQQTAGSPVLLAGYAFIQALHFGPLAFSDAKYLNMTANFKVKKSRS